MVAEILCPLCLQRHCYFAGRCNQTNEDVNFGYNLEIMDLPVLCDTCGHEQMVDWERLEVRPISSLYTAHGYTCSKCSTWKRLWISTVQLLEHIRRLETMQPTHPSFWYHYSKTMKRSLVIQRRGRISENGTIRDKDMAIPR